MTQEIYALSGARNSSVANVFLAKFLPKRSGFASDYPVPECADSPTIVFPTTDTLMTYLDTNVQETYSIYWNNLDEVSQIRQAMLFYTSDGCLILGLAVAESQSKRLLDGLIGFAGTQHGMFGHEERPPETAREFIQACQKSNARESRKQSKTPGPPGSSWQNLKR